MTKEERNLKRMNKEINAGGYSQSDGTVEFYLRINSLLRENMTVLDYGAGRGAILEQASSKIIKDLANIKKTGAKVFGVDIDPAILVNPYLDEAHVIDETAPIPFEDGTFDIVYADWVIEHINNPQLFSSEIYRTLKPGGWFCARTPNRWGITGIATNIIPNSLHFSLLRVLQPDRKEIDIFPTRYKLNTASRLKSHFPDKLWNNCSYYHNSTAPYVQGVYGLLWIANTYLKFAPRFLATNLHVFLQKRAEGSNNMTLKR